MVSQKN